MRVRLFAVVVVASLLFSQMSVHAGIVSLSDYSSSPNTAADLLDAEVSFNVVGTVLTIEIENLTAAGDNGFNIRELYFNATENVTVLSLDTGLTDWSLCTALVADGFGLFDYALIGTDIKQYEIDGGQIGTFTLNVSGSDVSGSSFYTDFSIAEGAPPMILAAKFVRGPSNMSGYGATDIPEPGTIALLGLGGLALLKKRRA